MQPEITPEPSPEEREAILRALAEVTATDDRAVSEWRRRGMLEIVLGDKGHDLPPGWLDADRGP